jgi:signal transduction histidine kinase
MLKEKRNDIEEKLNDASIDRILAIDKQWNIIAWNKTSATITGIQKEDILGTQLTKTFPLLNEDPEMISAFRSAMDGMISFLPVKPSVFNRELYENHFIPLKIDEDEVIGVMNIMHDVAHRIKAERQLQTLNAALNEQYAQLEKVNTELATFTSITGNELKEPIKNIYVSLEMIITTDAQNLSNSSKGKLRRVQASLNRMNLLLEDILALSKISSFSDQMTDVNTQTVFEQTVIEMERKIEDRKVVINNNGLPVIRGSAQMIHYLFHNLLDNAIKFHAQGRNPVITVSSGIQQAGSDEGPDHIFIQFADNGIGFEPEQVEKIFIMFEKLHSRREYPGSGMGLTICRKIMEAHNGFIQATAIPGEGSTFTCYFPINKKEVSNGP